MRELEEILFPRQIPIDLIVYTPQEIKERLELGDFFIEDILKNGLLIYKKK